MKTVFTNAQTAHVWAQQNQEHGKSSNGQFYFRNKTIYSYRDSWPLSTFATPNIVLINNTSYSVTTSKHSGYVRNALSSSVTKYTLSRDALDYYVSAWNGDFSSFVKQLIRDCEREYTNALNSAIKRRKEALRASDINTALRYIQDTLLMLNDLEMDAPDKIVSLRDTLLKDNLELLDYHKARVEKTKADAEKQRQIDEEKRKALITECIDDWYNMRSSQRLIDAGNYAIRNGGKVYMRINGDDIETSRGARFPLSHAIKAFKFIRMIKELNSKINKPAKPFKTIHLGHFQIDEITPEGHVRAGCHFVEWDQIERLATVLKIYP